MFDVGHLVSPHQQLDKRNIQLGAHTVQRDSRSSDSLPRRAAAKDTAAIGLGFTVLCSLALQPALGALRALGSSIPTPKFVYRMPPLGYLPGAPPQVLRPRSPSRPARKISSCRARIRSGTSLRSTRSGCPQWEVPRVGTPAPEVQGAGVHKARESNVEWCPDASS
jgi:hypothetical protein